MKHLWALLFLLLRSSQAWVPLATLSHQRQGVWLLQANNKQKQDDDEYERPYYPKARVIDESLLGDLTGGRPGAIIETEEQLALKQHILHQVDDGTRQYPAWLDDYGELQQDEEAEYDIDDPTAIDAGTLGTWTIQDLRSKFDYEWDPHGDDPDPNWLEMNQDRTTYLPENPKDDDGVEIGYNPFYGPSNPIDTRSIINTKDSYMIDMETRNETMLKPQFPDGDLEIEYNEDVVKFRESLGILLTRIDPFLPAEIKVPSQAAQWHGYPEQTHFEPQNYTHNRFTPPHLKTDFDSMTPYRARQYAVELARSKNAEWLPDGVSQQWHQAQRQPYEEYGTLVGTLRKGDCDEQIVQAIQPALQIFGSCVDLLSIDGTVFRFAYHGLMKNRHGMSCWMETLLKDCGVDVTGVIFETGFRKRDFMTDGGDPWQGPSN